MPSKHYLPEMSDSPLHWVTRPLRSSTLRHTQRRRPAARWFPTTVKLDDTGQAIVEFYTSDAPADYDISIEGITQNGKIIQLKKFGLTADSR